MTKPRIGFIGLGLMGAAMVGRLQDLGYALTITANRSRPNIDAAVAKGAAEVATARAVAAASDIVMLCMDTSASVEARMRGVTAFWRGCAPAALWWTLGPLCPRPPAPWRARQRRRAGRIWTHLWAAPPPMPRTAF